METQLAGLVSQCVFCRNGLFSNVCSVRHHFAILGQISGSKGPKVNDPAGFPWNGYCIAAMGAVQNVWELMVLRMLQGVFAGFVSNANSLIATETPKKQAGAALGTMASGVTGGTLLVPLMGGALVSMFSYRMTFFITGLILLLIFLPASSSSIKRDSCQ